MAEDQVEEEVLAGVGHDRRTFVKRLVAGTAFAIPVVSSFDMHSLRMPSVSAQIPNSSFSGTFYKAVEPTRIINTRAGAPLGAGGTLAVGFAALTPPGTTAVVINLTVTQPTAGGFLRAKAFGSSYTPADRNTSVINFVAGQTVANEITVALDANRVIEIINHVTGSTHVIIDFVGYFVNPT